MSIRWNAGRWGKQETEEGKSTALTAEPEVRTIKRGAPGVRRGR